MWFLILTDVEVHRRLRHSRLSLRESSVLYARRYFRGAKGDYA